MNWVKYLPEIDMNLIRKANEINILSDEIRAVNRKKNQLEKELVKLVKENFTNDQIIKAIDSEMADMK